MTERIEEIQSEEEEGSSRRVVLTSPREVHQVVNLRKRLEELKAKKKEESSGGDDFGPMATPKSGPQPQPKKRPQGEGEGGGAAASHAAQEREEQGEIQLRGGVRRRKGSATTSSDTSRGDRDPSEPRVNWSDREQVMQHVFTYLPKPFTFYAPSFKDEYVFVGLPYETMEDLIRRVRPNWDDVHQHLLPEGVIPRVMLKPDVGSEDGYFGLQTKEGLQVEGRIHRKERRKFFDAAEEHQDKDPWRRGTMTLMFFETGDRTIVIQERRGNRMKLTKSHWVGYTLTYKNALLQL